MIKLLFLFLFASFAASRILSAAFAAEPFLKPNDVIALVGGEDMVAAAEYGYLELLLTRALPDHRLKFRCLAWEGDTVFEQRRDLNFPTWEEQLEKIGATVVICQFGQMESLAGKEKLPEFIAAYEKLIGRFRAGGKRRIILVSPAPAETAAADRGNHIASMVQQISSGLSKLAQKRNALFVDLVRVLTNYSNELPGKPPMTRDGFHLSTVGHWYFAEWIDDANWSAALRKDIPSEREPHYDAASMHPLMGDSASLRQLIVAKNQLWDRYWRVQNWAFLAGDRTTQASSRDHLDPTKRWFPAEREQFLPLIEKKEQEIWALAAKLR